MIIRTINPSTEAVLNEYVMMSEDEVSAQIEAAHLTYRVWRKTSFSQRQQLMLKMAGLLLEKKESYAALMAKEMGKPITSGQAEIEKCAWLCKHYAEKQEPVLSMPLLPLIREFLLVV